jgi:hypothetical protein
MKAFRKKNFSTPEWLLPMRAFGTKGEFDRNFMAKVVTNVKAWIFCYKSSPANGLR